MDKNLTNINDDTHAYLTSNHQVNGIIHISHGMAEHIGRYQWLIKKLNGDGYHVISIDHRGHGKKITNYKNQGYFSDSYGWKKVGDDLIDLVNFTNSKYPDLNQYLIAHSMGSWISLSVLIDNIKIDGLILSGSGLVPKHLIFLQMIITNLSALLIGDKSESLLMHKITFKTYNNFFKPTNTESDWLTSDIASVDNYLKDPLCGFKSKVNLWRNMVKIFSRVFKEHNYKNVDKEIPIYIISGTDDPVGGFGKGVNKLYKFLSKIFTNVKIDLVANARHEVINETSKDKTYTNMIKFLQSI